MRNRYGNGAVAAKFHECTKLKEKKKNFIIPVL